MTQPLSEKLIALEIDVDQWRRDIQTFVDLTIKELHAINNELSSGFASGDAEAVGTSRTPASNGHIGQAKAFPAARDERSRTSLSHSDSRNGNLAPFTETQTDDRLATLKRKLAERVSGQETNAGTHANNQAMSRN